MLIWVYYIKAIAENNIIHMSMAYGPEPRPSKHGLRLASPQKNIPTKKHCSSFKTQVQDTASTSLHKRGFQCMMQSYWSSLRLRQNIRSHNQNAVNLSRRLAHLLPERLQPLSLLSVSKNIEWGSVTRKKSGGHAPLGTSTWATRPTSPHHLYSVKHTSFLHL
jgi:hypothetical protein